MPSQIFSCSSEKGIKQVINENIFMIVQLNFIRYVYYSGSLTTGRRKQEFHRKASEASVMVNSMLPLVMKLKTDVDKADDSPFGFGSQNIVNLCRS